jgi:4-hydroxybenzoate polyprenyltransferase
MKDPIEKADFAPKRFRAFIDLVRPFTLLAPLFGGLSGSFLGLIIEGNISAPVLSTSSPFFDWPGVPLIEMFTGIVALILLNAASNTLNQVYDRDIDRINKSYRPIPSGIVSPKEGFWIAILLYGFTLWRAALINRWFFILIIILALFTIFYNIPPLRFKKRLWIANLSIAIPRGILGFVAAWSITADITSPVPWLIGSIMCIFLIGSTTAKDFTDMEGDKRFGMRTLPVVYGKKMAIFLSIPFLILPFFLLGIYWFLNLMPGNTIYMVVFMLVWSGIVTYLFFKEADKEDRHFENSPVWMQFYLILMGMQVGFLLVYIFN